MKNLLRSSIFIIYFFSSVGVLAADEIILDPLNYQIWGEKIICLLDDQIYAEKRKYLIDELENKLINEYSIETPQKLLAFYLVHHAMDLSSEHILTKDTSDEIYLDIRTFYRETSKLFEDSYKEDDRFTDIIEYIYTLGDQTTGNQNIKLFTRMRNLWQLAYNTLDVDAQMRRKTYVESFCKKLNNNQNFNDLSTEKVLNFIQKNTWEQSEYMNNEKIISLKKIIDIFIKKMNQYSTKIKY